MGVSHGTLRDGKDKWDDWDTWDGRDSRKPLFCAALMTLGHPEAGSARRTEKMRRRSSTTKSHSNRGHRESSNSLFRT
jgi:hypothetical protein